MDEKEKVYNNWTPTETVILERRSVRKYSEKQVPEYLVRRIIEAGRFAPSAGNSQPWKFLVIRDHDMLQEMEKDVVTRCKIFNAMLNWRKGGITGKLAWLNAQFMIRFLPNELHPIPFSAIDLMANKQFMLFHGAPTVIYILMDKRGVGKPLVDVGICGQNMVLAAHSLGLGTCWVGFVELLKYGTKWKKKLGVEYPYQIVESIALGYPVGKPDGMIERETHQIDWFENGEKRVLY